MNIDNLKACKQCIREAYDRDDILTHRYPNGYVEYCLFDGNIIILNLFIRNDVDWFNNDLFVPEVIDGKQVCGIASGALDNFGKVRRIVIPETVWFIEKNAISDDNLSSKQRNFYFAEKAYIKIRRGKEKFENDGYSIISWYPWKTEILPTKETYKDFTRIPVCSISKKDWVRPDNGVWMFAGVLYRYLGKSKSITINASMIESGAFYGSLVENIKFDKEVTKVCFRSIDSCKNLKSISFTSDECKFEQLFAFNCSNLSSIDWPEDFDCDGMIIDECPLIDEVVKGGKLLYFNSQGKETIEIREGITHISEFAITGREWKKIIFPTSLRKLGHPITRYFGDQTFIFQAKVFEWMLDKTEIALRQVSNGTLTVYVNEADKLRRQIALLPSNLKIVVKEMN